MKVLLLATVMVFGLLCPPLASAGENGNGGGAAAAGIELDAFPYLAGGYYGSLWYGKDHLRARGVIARAEVPSFMLSSGYRDNRLEVYALIVDYFSHENFEGWWFGAGLEYWKGRIGHKEESATGEYTNLMATAGCGFVWKLTAHFYLNPWIAAHQRVGGDSAAAVGGRQYHPPQFVPEVSVKAGWEF